jgi:carboxyl-terminal processing protease
MEKPMRYRSRRPSMCRALHIGIAALCSLGTLSSQTPEGASAMSASAYSYLGRALDLMQQNALHKKEIDWPALRIETFWHAAGAQSTVDTYPGIFFALSQLKEYHSFLRLPDNLSDRDKRRSWAALNSILGPRNTLLPRPPASPFRTRTDPAGHLIRSGGLTFAYVVVPACGSKHSNLEENVADFQKYADTLRDISVSLEKAHPVGWIIDLRGNGGGNMYPMLAGIGFVLGEGSAGSFVSLEGNTQSVWSYRSGKAIVSGATEIVDARVTKPPLTLTELPSVAVLIDSGTISSGEAIAISFAGRLRTRFFGTHTFGLASGNQMFPLADGAALFLNTAMDADRLGRTYPHGIEPDVSFPEPPQIPDETSDPVLQPAQVWLATVALEGAAAPPSAIPRKE